MADPEQDIDLSEEPGTEPEAPAATEPEPEPSLAERFPALRLVGIAPRRRIPYIQQLTVNECGLASLAMVLGYYGKHVTLEQMRNLVSVDVNGLTAQALVEVGGFFGLRVRAVSGDLDALELLPPASILHWRFNHFVVFEAADSTGVTIVDPAAGRLHLPLAKFSQFFTGVALLCEPNEDFAPNAKGKNRIWRYFREALSGSGLWPRIAVTSLILQLFALGVPLATGAIVDRIIPRADQDLLLVMTAGLCGIVLFNFLASWVRSHLFVQLRAVLDVRLTLGFLEHLVELPLRFFHQRPQGDLLSRLSSKQAIIEGLTSVTLSALLDGTLALGFLVLLLVMSPGMGGAVLVLAFLQVVTYWRNADRLKELNTKNLDVNGRTMGGVAELILGMETLKSMGSERAMLRNWTNLFAQSINAQLERGSLEANVDAWLQTLRMASPLVVLVLGAFEVLKGELSLGAMLAFNALAVGFLTPLAGLVQMGLSLRTLASHAERLDDVHDAPRERDRGTLLPAGRLKGGITLEHVTFRYSAITPPVLKDVSLRIQPGQFVALVGPSGSGKTTLAGLILGFYPPTEGRVLFDGVDLATLDPNSVRRQLGVVTQHLHLFQGSVRSNLSLMEQGISAKQLAEAAKRAHVHEDILRMPLGYDSFVSEGGNTLSGGQRQRLALARALVRKPAILLLDEATSALDTVTERAVQQELATLACTKLVIAHRLSTVQQADLILVVDQGRIAEAGTHTELLARRGVYANLVAAQIKPG